MTANSFAIRTILVAVDFSSHANTAMQRGLELARLFHSTLIAVHCLPDLTFIPSASDFGLMYNDLSAVQSELQTEASKNMNDFLLGFDTAGIVVQGKIVTGDPQLALADICEADHVDLVVTGRSGHSGWEQFLLGSTSRGLVGRCPTSVLSVHDEWVAPPRSILVGTDLSETSNKAVLEAIAFASVLGAELHVLHVIDENDMPHSADTPESEGESKRQTANKNAEQRLNDFIASIDCSNVRLEKHLSWGTPWKELCKTAEHLKSELVVVGNVGSSGLKGLIHSNTADQILSHFKSSVLAVKPAPSSDAAALS